MAARQFRELDTLIETALRGECFRPTPPGLHREIEARLCIAAARLQERRRLCIKLFVLLGIALLTVLGPVAILWQTGLAAYAERGIPGALGHYDYFVTSVLLHWTYFLGASVALLGVCSALVILVTVAPVLIGPPPRRS